MKTEQSCPELKQLHSLNKIAIMLSSERLVQFVVRFVEKSWSVTSA